MNNKDQLSQKSQDRLNIIATVITKLESGIIQKQDMTKKDIRLS